MPILFTFVVTVALVLVRRWELIYSCLNIIRMNFHLNLIYVGEREIKIVVDEHSPCVVEWERDGYICTLYRVLIISVDKERATAEDLREKQHIGKIIAEGEWIDLTATQASLYGSLVLHLLLPEYSNSQFIESARLFMSVFIMNPRLKTRLFKSFEFKVFPLKSDYILDFYITIVNNMFYDKSFN